MQSVDTSCPWPGFTCIGPETACPYVLLARTLVPQRLWELMSPRQNIYTVLGGMLVALGGAHLTLANTSDGLKILPVDGGGL
jgi:hypothetical protein